MGRGKQCARQVTAPDRGQPIGGILPRRDLQPELAIGVKFETDRRVRQGERRHDFRRGAGLG
jgi:hypothetical protein